MTLSLTPISFEQACLLVRAWHRHHRPPVGHKYSIGLAQDDELVGAIIVGRPVARHYDDGHTLEVLRSVVADDARMAGRESARLPTAHHLHPGR